MSKKCLVIHCLSVSDLIKYIRTSESNKNTLLLIVIRHKGVPYYNCTYSISKLHNYRFENCGNKILYLGKVSLINIAFITTPSCWLNMCINLYKRRQHLILQNETSNSWDFKLKAPKKYKVGHFGFCLSFGNFHLVTSTNWRSIWLNKVLFVSSPLWKTFLSILNTVLKF